MTIRYKPFQKKGQQTEKLFNSLYPIVNEFTLILSENQLLIYTEFIKMELTVA